MPVSFDLVITADAINQTTEIRLLDEHGSQLAYRHTDFKKISLSRRLGLFDLRNYIRNYVDVSKETAAVADIGVCIAEKVLGEEIFLRLWKSQSQRRLRIFLPGATAEDNRFAAALARIPWEIARPGADKDTLEQRSLTVCVVHEGAEPDSQPLTLGHDEPLRILLVFAEAPGSRPLGARRERQELQRLLQREIYPQRRVVAHILSHGVTRERLKSQIQENNGYHIVHWSGHGQMNTLELVKQGGMKDTLSGEGLLDIFVKAGGFVPRLFFLSACHSGDIVQVRDWKDFLIAADGSEPSGKDIGPSVDTKEIPLEQETGYTGTAHALLSGGVPSVLAMRYSVGDDYASGLAVEFYRALLAHAQPKSIAVALNMARQAVRDPMRHEQARFAACDHATPVLYGAEQLDLIVPQGRSPALDTRDPRLHRIAELTVVEHTHFVGRTRELSGLGADFVGASHSVAVKPVAVITGLGGMGKTALAAEALALWETRFQWVLIYQAKPNALPFEATLTDIHLKLMGELGRYHDHVRSNPADAIHRVATSEFTGPERLKRLINNLVRELRDEAVLLVLDNFETNLKPHPVSTQQAAEPTWQSQDPTWDECLRRLAVELVGTPSRVLVTCRHPLAALIGMPFHATRLGPLSPGEAALYLREHPNLSRMVFGEDATERELAKRLLTASRFHPLLMDRLARLATGDAALRSRFLEALETLETRSDFSNLPTLFETGERDSRELAYLNDALAVSIDRLIESVDRHGRRLLWIIALANDPETLHLVQSVWNGAVSDKERRRLPDPALLLRYLVSLGLVTEERSEPHDTNPNLTCHELVRERIRAWMERNPSDRAGQTESSVRIAYATTLVSLFAALLKENEKIAVECGRRAIVYYVEAEAFEELGHFALAVVVSVGDPQLLGGLLPHLQAAARSAPPGRPSWLCLLVLADAMDNAGRTNESFPFYQEAAALAKAAAEKGGDDAKQAWHDYANIIGNCAVAFRHVSNFHLSRELQKERASALTKAGAHEVEILSTEVEALRLDVEQGEAERVLPDIEKRVAKMQDWWNRARKEGDIPGALIAHFYESALDLDRMVRTTLNDWEAALGRTDEILKLAADRGQPIDHQMVYQRNRAVLLTQLGRFTEAKDVLDSCLEIFRNDPINRARTFHTLSDLFAKQGDFAQAIIQGRRSLALLDTLPNPGERSIAHSALALYFQRSEEARGRDEAAGHRLAALVYGIVTSHAQGLGQAVQSYAESINLTDPTPVVPNVAALLTQAQFQPLKEWLREHAVDMAKLQAYVDGVLEEVRMRLSEQNKMKDRS